MTETTKSPIEEKKLIDRIIYFAAIIYPLTTIPQVVEIFAHKSAGNISLATWVSYDLFTVIFLWYAIEKKLKPLVIEYCLWIVTITLVVIGIMLYR